MAIGFRRESVINLDENPHDSGGGGGSGRKLSGLQALMEIVPHHSNCPGADGGQTAIGIWPVGIDLFDLRKKDRGGSPWMLIQLLTSQHRGGAGGKH